MQSTIPTTPEHRWTDLTALLFSYNAAFGGDAASSRPLGEESEVSTTDKQKLRALVVDDAPDVTEMLAMVMRFAGYDVVTVFSANDALETARTEQFDVVVSDIGMPGMNGYELAEAIRTLPDYRAVPLIAVTGFAMYDDRDRALASGFNAFLTKPINPMDLIDLVRQLGREPEARG
ncbi:MAG TPA: response regulator [Pyrinomonadaceae bacterium]|jgi:CheY-like chemotaxis protein